MQLCEAATLAGALSTQQHPPARTGNDVAGLQREAHAISAHGDAVTASTDSTVKQQLLQRLRGLGGVRTAGGCTVSNARTSCRQHVMGLQLL